MTIIEQCFLMALIFAIVSYITIAASYWLEVKKDSIFAIFTSFFMVLLSAASVMTAFICAIIGALIYFN